MPIEFCCSSCQAILRTPDQTAGKAARCPRCGNVEPIPKGAVESGFGETGSPPQLGHAIASSDYPQSNPAHFDSSKNPYSVQPSPYAQEVSYGPTWGQQIDSRQAARARLQPPAITTLIFCIGTLLFAMLSMLGGLISLVENGGLTEEIVGLIGCAGVMLLEVLGIFGSISMLRMRNYRFCVAGMICAIISGVFCCLLPSGFGVWGLVVLLQPGVRQNFH